MSIVGALRFMLTHRLDRLLKKAQPHPSEKGTSILEIIVFMTQAIDGVFPMTCGPRVQATART